MSYFRRNGRGGLLGLGGVENCGNDQVWDPNVVVNAGTAYEIKGQCMPRGNYAASDLENVNAYPGVVKTKGASSGGSKVGIVSSILGVLTAPAAPGPVIISGPSSGMSTTTKLALAGGAALVLVAVLAKRN